MKTEPSPGGVIRAERIWGGKWRWKWRCWGEGQVKGSPKLLCWTRRQKWWMPGKAERGRCVLGIEIGEELPMNRRRQGKCSSGKARRSEGMAGLVPISGDRAEIPAESRNPFTHGLSAAEDRQWWQRSCSQMVKPSWVWEMPRGTHTGLLQIYSHHLQSWITAENQEKSQLVLGAEFLSMADTDSDVRFSTFPSPVKDEVRKISHDWSEE